MRFKTIKKIFFPFIVSKFQTLQPIIATERLLKSFHIDTICSSTSPYSTDEHFRLCSVCERLKVRDERWKDSLAVEGWGERGISVKVRLIGHTVTADVHLVSAWRCCGKPDRGYTRIHHMMSSMKFQSILTPVATKFIAYRPRCTSYASFGLSTLFCPITNKVFDELHLANLIMQ